MDFKKSKTKENLMKAFAGESQARNRYTFAAEFAKNHGLDALSKMFLFTAEQELAHAKVFYDNLKELSGENINIEGGYPVEIFDDMKDILSAAMHDEYSEYGEIYKSFAEVAKDEGFSDVARAFRNIAKIEKIHGDRFGEYLQKIKEDKMFSDSGEGAWFCTNCGHIHFAKEAPEKCPVCSHQRGYFIRAEEVSYTPYCLIKKNKEA